MTFEICGFQQAYAMTLRMQKEVIKKGEKRLVTVCVDCTDLCILRWLVNFYPRMTKIHLEDGEWVSISFKKMQTDLPLIDISRNAFSERLRKLADFGILKYRLDKGKVGTRALFAFGENYSKLVEIPEHGQPDMGIGSNGYGVSGQTDTGVGSTQHGVSGQPDNIYSSVCNSSVLDSDVSNIYNPSTTCKDYMYADAYPQADPQEKATRPKINYQEIADMYNTICTSLPRVTTLSDNRKKAIAARLKTYTAEQFDEVFRKAEASRFLKGGNNRNWTASFDWLIKDANFAKVLDGNYDDSKAQTLPQQTQSNSSGGEIVTINGKEYIKKGLRYYIPNGSGIAVDPFAEDDLPY